MGAEVVRTAPDTIEVDGRKRLRGASHSVIPDRIETGTFLVAAAVTGGQVTLENAACDHVTALIDVFKRVGVPIECGAGHPHRRDRPPARRPARRRHRDLAVPRPRDRRPATDLRPAHPGRAAPRASTSRSSRTASNGSPSCASSGASIDIEDAHNAAIHGPAPLHGAEATIGDLRAGASLILAALAADGTSLIHGAHHVERGYENIDRKFQQLGASIVRSADTAP